VAEAAAEPYRKDAASGAARRKGDKLVTLNVQQIAATQEQVCPQSEGRQPSSERPVSQVPQAGLHLTARPAACCSAAASLPSRV
jgi:hypothetical protein